MNRVVVAVFFFFSFFAVDAQVLTANDSATTGFNNTKMTFYNIKTGAKTTVANNDWHLALSVRPSQFPSNTLQGTTMRINGAFGVKVYEVPGFTADSFSVTVDTFGYKGWLRVHDSDSVLDEGALNTGYNIGTYFYGWGQYGGSPNHDVAGTKVYLFELPGRRFKKINVDQLDRDTAWVLKIADIDNSNLQTLRISKGAYAGKNLVYLNLLNNLVHDKEPLAADWQMLFTRYAALDAEPGTSTVQVGVLTNKGVTTAKRAHGVVTDNTYNNLSFSVNMNTIGWGWKYLAYNQALAQGKNFDQLASYYRVFDSLTYFIKSANGDVTKIVFTGYDGPNEGMIYFYKEELTATAIMDFVSNSEFNLYPNPCSTTLNINAASLTSSVIRVTDMSGKLLLEQQPSRDNFQLNTSDFPNGVYLVSIAGEEGIALKKFVVAR
jgi:hypothetical protein